MKHIVAPTIALTSSFLALASTASAAELKLHFPLTRTALQTNESVPIAVIRSDTAALAADDLKATLTGADGSKLQFGLPVAGVPVRNGVARATEHLNLNARLLRPGRYLLAVEVNGASATSPLEVYSHLRRSTYKLINWGSPTGPANMHIQGEAEGGLGYNMMYDKPADLTEYIRAGVDVVPVNVMSGGHQMDLRSEADWSDPYVTRGGTRRVARAAFQYRSFPNLVGINYYDEPGLTWHKHPTTGEWVPHGIPSQGRAFEGAMGKPAPQYQAVDPKDANSVRDWKEFGTWKLGFMDAAWREAAFGVSQVRPDLISNTQSQYGWSAFTDGYYFNVTRSLPVASGHGGYDDLNGGYFAPSFYLEMSRARDRERPNWYLPTWYRSITDENMRLENYLSFAAGIQGIMTPPWIEPTGKTPSAKAAIIETNRAMGRLGTIFNTMPATPRPLAMLYSMSNNLHAQAQDRTINYAHGYKHGQSLLFGYLAGQTLQQPVDAVVEEDVLDGTLAAKHKAILLPSVTFLPTNVVRALEEFAAGGGKVYLTGDSTVTIKGAINLGVTPQLPDQAAFEALHKEIMASPDKDWSRLAPYTSVGKFLEGTQPLAKALQAELAKAGLAPIFETDQPEVVAQRHASGDVEYIFAINATFDRTAQAPMGVVPVAATIKLPADGRPIYDAMTGTPLSEGKTAVFKAKGRTLEAKLDFIEGGMRVFARTARPIGGIRLGTPQVSTAFTREEDPIRLSLAAALVDTGGKVLSGSVPLRVQVVDALGAPRYDLHRATQDGLLHLTLPLAANDPAGAWKVTVTELLSGKAETVSFSYSPSARNGSVLGGTHRAVMLTGEEPNLFRFARTNRTLTIVPGAADYSAAVQRLQRLLAPWGVTATVMEATAAAKGRVLSEEEAYTWIGLNYAAKGQIKPNEDKQPTQTGFAVRGAAILLGTPEDNPLIKNLQAEKFLPFAPQAKDFPGVGKGYLAWQRDAIGPGQESVTLIAHDAAGMDEAVGTFYEAVAGLQPLTRWTLPTEASISPATKLTALGWVAPTAPEAAK